MIKLYLEVLWFVCQQHSWLKWKSVDFHSFESWRWIDFMLFIQKWGLWHRRYQQIGQHTTENNRPQGNVHIQICFWQSWWTQSLTIIVAKYSWTQSETFSCIAMSQNQQRYWHEQNAKCLQTKMWHNHASRTRCQIQISQRWLKELH